MYANDFSDYDGLKNREIVIHKYVGTNNRQQEYEQHITRGYAAVFDDLIEMVLPAVKFTKSEEHTKVYLYPQKSLKDMTKQDKIEACYQHACLMYEDDKAIKNPPHPLAE